MVFKINVSHKGRTWKAESDNESLIRMKIGDKLSGDVVSAELDGYELEITGTSDIAGFPGIKGQAGPQLRGVLLVKGDLGMRATKPEGLRKKKSVRGEEISEKTMQINTKVLKEGKKKFDEVCPAKPPKEKPSAKPAAPAEAAAPTAPAPVAEAKKEEVPKPAEEKKAEQPKKVEPKKEEVKPAEKKA
jgi:small subunit ribosomal protein S6e